MVDVRELKENYPEFAMVLDTEEEEPPNFSELAYKQVPVHDVAVYDHLSQLEQSVPMDGEVVYGSATVTTEHLTGEVKPLDLRVRDGIPGGARTLDGSIVVEEEVSIMASDDINDVPALAAATVAIVLSQRASATAVAVAGVLLLRDNISGIPFCIAKSRHTTFLVLLHDGCGTLHVCLNSIRALNNPTWSWRQDLLHLLDQLRAFQDT